MEKTRYLQIRRGSPMTHLAEPRPADAGQHQLRALCGVVGVGIPAQEVTEDVCKRCLAIQGRRLNHA